MAKIYPDYIEDFQKPTEGEKRVFRFLKEAARPHNDFICWYEPPIGKSGKEPDFILLSKKHGLLIIEVKDWTSNQIVSINPHQFTILEGESQKKRTNPDKQAKGYVDALKQELSKVPEFLSDDIKHRGNLRIPVGRIVAFPNISHDEYARSSYRWLIASERTLFKDDLDSAGEIFCDVTGNKFVMRISGAFPFRFTGLTQKEVDKLCSLIWPDIQIKLPLRRGAGKIRFQTEVRTLDESQARLALKLGSGHQIIKGPPGAGKTLILAYRCSHLLKYQPDKKRILFICYNIALVSYLKRLLQEKKIGVGENGVHVLHFFQLCSRVLEEPVHYENEDNDYYDLVIAETLEKLRSGNSLLEPFDAIFVDEAQDFSNEMLKVLSNLLNPEGDLVISLDSYQDLYRRDSSWKSVGIKASGRTHYIKNAYRNTKALFEFSQKFIGETTKSRKQMALFPDDAESSGEHPEIKYFKNLEEIEAFLPQDISRAIDEEEYKRSEIAVIYDDKVYGPDRFTYDNRALPMRILNSLESSGIPASWISRDVRTKEMYDITTDRVSVISIHSSKGLDFDLVYLVGIDHIKPSRTVKKSMDTLVYVAMTRAKYRLVIPYTVETEIIKRLKGCL